MQQAVTKWGEHMIYNKYKNVTNATNATLQLDLFASRPGHLIVGIKRNESAIFSYRHDRNYEISLYLIKSSQKEAGTSITIKFFIETQHKQENNK